MKDRHLARVQVPLCDLQDDWPSRVEHSSDGTSLLPFKVVGAHTEPDGYLQGYIMLYLEGPKFPKCYPGGPVWCARYEQEDKDARR